jgi:hypothetical protein
MLVLWGNRAEASQVFKKVIGSRLVAPGERREVDCNESNEAT